jgi:copper(I)-binding protein
VTALIIAAATLLRRPSASRDENEEHAVIRSRRRTGRPRRLIVLAIAALIPVLAGCEAGTDAPTQQWHNPTDGAGKMQGNISLRDVFVLGAPLGSALPPGQSAGVYFALISNGAPDKLLSISAPGTAKSVLLPGGVVSLASQQVVLLTGPEPKVILEGLTRPLSGGGSVLLRMNFQSEGTVALTVPVLPQAQYYSTYSTAPTPTPTPTATPATGRHGRHRATATPSPSR